MNKMIIYLIHEKYLHTYEIALDKQCKVLDSQKNYPELKHTLWWKGLLINEIHILCDEHAVKVQKREPYQIFSKSTDWFKANKYGVQKDIIYDDEQLLSRDQIEEMKESLILFKHKKMSVYELELQILKLLYCYVLPAYTLLRIDLDSLHRCLSLVRGQMQKIDDEIIKHEKDHVKFSLKLKEKRAFFRGLTESEIKIVIDAGDSKFFDTIMSHLQEDCMSLEELYSNCQKQFKEKRDISEDGLPLQNKETNTVCHKMLNLKMFISKMELLKMYNPKENSSHDFEILSTFYEVYMDTYQQMIELKKTSCSEKLRLRIIEECVTSTIENVEMFGETKGSSVVNNEELKSVGIVWESTLDRWQNCEEKVIFLLNNPKINLIQLHLKFKEELNLKISSILSEQTLFQTHSKSEREKDDTVNNFTPESDCPQYRSFNQELDVMKPLSDNWAGLIDQITTRIYEQIFKMWRIIIASYTFEKSEHEEIPWIYKKILLFETKDTLLKLFELILKTQCEEYCLRVRSLCCYPVPKYILKSTKSKKIVQPTESRNENDLYHKTEFFKCANSFQILADNPKNRCHSDNCIPSSLAVKQSSNGSVYIDCLSSAFHKKSVSILYKMTDKDIAKENIRLCPPKVSLSTEDDNEMELISHKDIGKICSCFQSSLVSIEKFFSIKCLYDKLDNMVITLKCIAYTLTNIIGRSTATADDIVNVLSALIYSLTEEKLKRLFYDLYFIDAFMPNNHRAKLRGNALVHFQCSLEILSLESCKSIKNK